MTPKDIIVGALYKNIVNKDIYLGIGHRVMWLGTYGNNDSQFHAKHLVIVQSNVLHQIGLIIKEGDDVQPGLWENEIVALTNEPLESLQLQTSLSLIYAQQSATNINNMR